MRWKIDECPDANGNYTLREDDGTRHGDTETCVATVYGGILEQELIEAAPRLQEQVKLLREALEASKSRMKLAAEYLNRFQGACAYHGDQLVRAIKRIDAALEETKEEA